MRAMDWAYLDNNATTRPAREVIAAVEEACTDLWANPSSVHRMGQAVRQRVELARQSVATLIGARPAEIIFTSGGTESNNLALGGLLRGGDVLITTPTEHSAIREPADALEKNGVHMIRLDVDTHGQTDIEQLNSILQQHIERSDNRSRTQPSPPATVLLSIQWANNETGAIQPLGEVAALVAAHRERLRAAGGARKLLLHSDATQAVGKLPVDVHAVQVGGAGLDLLTLAAHKFHGPKGVGGLWVRTGLRLSPWNRGGPQERDRRGGTENVPGILGMGVAAELATRFLADQPAVDRVRAMRDRFERVLSERVPGVVVNAAGGIGERLWNTSNLGFPGLEAEAILLGLSERGVAASAGAACSSGSLDPSPILRAMGIPDPVAHGSVRFSLSRFTTDAEVDRGLEVVPRVVERLGRVLPVGSRSPL